MQCFVWVAMDTWMEKDYPKKNSIKEFVVLKPYLGFSCFCQL